MTVLTKVREPQDGSRTGIRGERRRRRRFRLSPALLFLAPSFLILGVFVLWPILVSFWYSLHEWTIGADDQPWVGLGNYIALTQDPKFWGALLHTVEITVISVAGIVVLGLALALALARDNLGSRIIRSAFFFPTVVSLTSIGLVWRFLLDPDLGLVGAITSALGLGNVGFLQSPQLALPTIIFVNIWKNAGFVMIILIAGLKGVPAERYEAARLDGAGSWALLRYITLPALRPTMLFGTLIMTIQSFQLFDLVYVMTGGGPLFSTDTLVTMLFREGFVNFQTGYAAAISWALFLVIVIISALQLRIFRYNDVD
ncbi:carbohydrate ABC transporter permease [Leifsonia sp. 71-9]|uniref:carbohydrate ABC transporter permease n=1 Tax=Leifsonia sp. 71-9 TaxID=1895934 RepID=UPI000925D445|nr:sugar ABC transporter permease [Leifsonia sp. 71-9]OJX75432.1 MAG: sugar ABC transporter permease [Leifsonia sp. 71-9]